MASFARAANGLVAQGFEAPGGSVFREMLRLGYVSEFGNRAHGGKIRGVKVRASVEAAGSPLRQGPWKLELCAGSGGWGNPKDTQALKQGLPATQLYNLASDIGERQNLASTRPDIVRQLTALLERYVAEGRSTPGAKQKNDAPVEIMKARPDENNSDP